MATGGSTRVVVAIGCALIAAAACGPAPEPTRQTATAGWQLLEPGLELGFLLSPEPATAGDGFVRVLRIDPEYFELRLMTASEYGGRARTAREWCKEHDLVAALNASMYQEDLLTSVSLMRTRTHTNNGHLTRHRAVLGFDRLEPSAPAVKIIDLECDDFEQWEPRYGTLVQSIRMLSCEGENVWEQQTRQWSIAAVGTDSAGRVLFVHVRSPFSTHDLIDVLVRLPLDLTSLMYAEGGHEAQLYVRGPEREYEYVGSFENAFGDTDDNYRAWPVPNVIGVVRRP
jgi:hypothetical protein